MNNGCKAFFTTNATNAAETEEVEVLSTDNCFQFEKGCIVIPVQFSTIHSVKGETHCATLYLETYNWSF